MRTEIDKLRSVRAPLMLLLAAQLVIVAGVSGLFLGGGADAADPVTARRAVAHAGLVSLFSLLLGILAVAGEYRHRTITDTYLGTPRRGRVIAAKLAVHTAAGVVFGLVSSVVAMTATAVWLSARGGALDLGSSAIWGTVAGCVAWNACFAAVGVGVGALIRNVTAAVAAALAWLALVEGIAGQLLGDLGRWLPFRSAQALEGVPFPGIDLLPQWAGGLALAGYAAVFVLLAASVTVRRDVT
ncbi:ABC transporter permease subunit [Plantactinospora siamensis]|uniref:ABC transporter permease subunit n=1 Tax=Plantactinospora siamensis TaxID=555372 RepID=A0ABV6P7W3_9ACTN